MALGLLADSPCAMRLHLSPFRTTKNKAKLKRKAESSGVGLVALGVLTKGLDEKP